MSDLEVLQAVFQESIAAHERFAAGGFKSVIDAAAAINRALRSGRKVLAFGNGGSAADAQHFVAELVGRFEGERQALAAIALTADATVVTAVANDYGFEHVFARQIEALGRDGDIALGISTSGRSKNVEVGLTCAMRCSMVTIALTGRDGGSMGRDAHIHINVAEPSTPRVQEVHRTVLHAMCSLVNLAATVVQAR
ncbi:MAG TPA: SIS domain-containing protein [Vicinamibacterales bacterium]|jgi:phosphoheptose isomerase|nr:SIS domain-containing protein [Vicinamibacterales bacterium]